jgi:hypothetical protein
MLPFQIVRGGISWFGRIGVAIRILKGADFAALERLGEIEILRRWVDDQIGVVPLGVCVERSQPYTIVCLRDHAVPTSSEDGFHARLSTHASAPSIRDHRNVRILCVAASR